MRSSKGKKAASVVAAFVASAAVLLFLLDLMLYPCTFIRNDIHAVTTEQKDFVLLGTSNGKMDLDPDRIAESMTRGSETPAAGQNLCVGGEYPIDAYYMTRLMAEKKRPRLIIFEVDPGYFTTEKETGNNYLLFYHEFPLSISKLRYFGAAMLDCDVRSGLFAAYEYSPLYEIPRIGETLQRKLSGDYDVSWFKGEAQEYHEDGFVERYPVDEEDFPSYDGFVFEGNQENLERNTAYLSKLIAFCREQGIDFLAAIMPLPEKSLERDTEQFALAWEYFDGYFAEKGVDFYNFNTDYYSAFPHSADHFTDYDGHMNGDSAREFSRIFGSIINIKGEFDHA